MSFEIHVSGEVAATVARVVPDLVRDLVASGIMGQDDALWGPDAQRDAARRLGWTDAVSTSRPLLPRIAATRDTLRAAGVDHILLCGMGGSSLAAEVICRTENVHLTVLDSTDPGQVLGALNDRLATAAAVISSKSGATVETDSLRRALEQAFRDAGIDPAERIIVVTDPGSSLDKLARAAGYTVFNADPDVGGRYSALTAFGIVPAGLAGADIGELLSEAEAILLELSVDNERNPGLVLGAAIAGSRPLRDKLALVGDGTHLAGFEDWAEQLVAESTGKLGRGLLPVVAEPLAPELAAGLDDLQVVRFVADASAHHLFRAARHEGEILVSASLGGAFMVWEFAVAVAGRLLGVNPFDQPDVEASKEAARGLLDARPATQAPAFTADGIEVRGTEGLLGEARALDDAVVALLSRVGSDGYVAVQAYVDRVALPQLAGIRSLLAARARRPVTFGWGPRFLHSTGQFHKGGPAVGVFLQILSEAGQDLRVPGRPFTFGDLIAAQAAGDAAVLARHGRPVLTLTLTDPETNLLALFNAVDE